VGLYTLIIWDNSTSPLYRIRSQSLLFQCIAGSFCHDGLYEYKKQVSCHMKADASTILNNIFIDGEIYTYNLFSPKPEEISDQLHDAQLCVKSCMSSGGREVSSALWNQKADAASTRACYWPPSWASWLHPSTFRHDHLRNVSLSFYLRLCLLPGIPSLQFLMHFTLSLFIFLVPSIWIFLM
jgi:hypothetical protein